MNPPYLLDTNILIALLRNKALGHYIRALFVLFSPMAPTYISVVTLGEIRAFARHKKWGANRRRAVDQLLRLTTPVTIDRPDVYDAYEDIYVTSMSCPGGAVTMKHNDMWIAACCRAVGAMLLTTDQDFDHLHPALVQRVYIDPTSALPTPPPPGTP
jgi:predicted nucleic acid-binding protein